MVLYITHINGPLTHFDIKLKSYSRLYLFKAFAIEAIIRFMVMM